MKDNTELWYEVGKILDFEEAEDAKADIKGSLANLPESDRENANRLIAKLHNKIHTVTTINYYEERSQEYDKVLTIFVRANSAGTPLEYSDQTWETTEAFKSPKPKIVGMVAFAGAKHAADLSKLSEVEAKAKVIDCLENVYKGVSSKVIASDFVNWPEYEWSKASYSFPKCGDILAWGAKFENGSEGKIHFAGEHTCYAFTGYMEGALQSGFRLARKLVSRDGGEW